jgi:ubiquinone/menaquinone biosynthesis C-methylase UbiE
MKKEQHFDKWPHKYDQWFETPIGKLVQDFEGEILYNFILPKPGEVILDAGCGTGMFTRELVEARAHIVGLELSLAMLKHGAEKLAAGRFDAVQGNMLTLPFADDTFDKTVSVTAIEFIADARQAISELFRVTKPGGMVVVATLNSLSPWAERRKRSGEKGHPLFKEVFFRPPAEMAALAPVAGEYRTVVHFEKNADPARAVGVEKRGSAVGLDTGAFLAFRWEKPKCGAI